MIKSEKKNKLKKYPLKYSVSMDIFFYLLKEHFVKLHDNIDVP